MLEVRVRVSRLGVIGAMPGQVGDAIAGRVAQGLVADAAIGVAIGVQGKGASDEIVVLLLVGGIGAEGIGIERAAVKVRMEHEIGAVNPQLHRTRFSHR